MSRALEIYVNILRATDMLCGVSTCKNCYIKSIISLGTEQHMCTKDIISLIEFSYKHFRRMLMVQINEKSFPCQLI